MPFLKIVLLSALVFGTVALAQNGGDQDFFASELRRLSAKVERPLPARGIPFPRIDGPKCKNDRIGIVGAGPSGIHMAYSLKEEGFRNVKILEKSNRIGGKSVHVEHMGATYSLSTFLLAPDYDDTLRVLMRRFGLQQEVRSAPITRFLPQDSYLSPLLTRQEGFLSGGDPRQTLRDIERYVDLHRDTFGTYEGELFRRPDNYTLRGAGGTFEQYLVDNGLSSLVPFFTAGSKSLGYDPPSQMPALQAMMFFTPRHVVLGILGGQIFYANNDGGFNRVFQEMIRDQNIDIRFNFEVRKVTKNYRGEFVVSDMDGREEVFDFLVWSGLLRDFDRAADSEVFSDRDLRRALRSNKGKHASASLVNMRNYAGKAPIQASLTALQKPFDHSILATADFAAMKRRISFEDYKYRDYLIDGDYPRSHSLSVFQYGRPKEFGDPIPSENELRREIRDYFRYGFNASDINVLVTVSWPDFYPRWSPSQFGQGLPWDVFDRQGQDGFWVIGDGVSFESTKSVFEYNRLLLRQARLPGRYQNCYEPGTDNGNNGNGNGNDNGNFRISPAVPEVRTAPSHKSRPRHITKITRYSGLHPHGTELPIPAHYQRTEAPAAAVPAVPALNPRNGEDVDDYNYNYNYNYEDDYNKEEDKEPEARKVEEEPEPEPEQQPQLPKPKPAVYGYRTYGNNYNSRHHGGGYRHRGYYGGHRRYNYHRG